jgi:prephenate dehydratase
MDNTKDEKRSAGCSRSANLTHSVVMTVGRSAGDLAKILEVIETYSSCLLHIESRSVDKAGNQHDVYVSCILRDGSVCFSELVHELEKQDAANVRLFQEDACSKDGTHATVS